VAETPSFFTEELFRELGEHLPDFVWVRDVESGRVLYVNPSWERVTGRPAPIGEHYSEFFAPIHPDDIERAREAARRSPLGGYDELLRFVHVSGSIRWVHLRTFPIRDASGRVYRVAGVGEDVTDVQRAREAHEATETKFRALVEHSTDVIAVIGPDATFQYLSPAFETVVGSPASEWLGRPSPDLVWPDDLERAMRLLREILDSPGRVIAWELRVRHRDGSWRWLEGASTNYTSDPAVAGIVVTCRDVTERRARDGAFRSMQQQLLQSQKMESVGRLAGGVAHDFNNLLTVITGNASLAKLDLRRDDPLWASLDRIEEASHSAASLTEQLLAFSRKQIVAPKVISLNAVIARTERMLTRLISEEVALETRLAPDLDSVRVDPAQVEQVLVNLAVNARDAMPEGGRLTIETANRRSGGEDARESGHDPSGDYVMLAVTDTGSGMTSEVRQRVFEPFFTTKEEGKGTGLGLSIVYGIVTQNGGQIEVSSEVGTGTTFTIYLPRVDAGPEAETEPTVAHTLGGSETVLLVEDAEPVRAFAAKVLTRLGYEVRACADGVEALEAVERLEYPVRLLVTDVVMPGMNGQVLAERVRASRPDVKVLFTSGYTGSVIFDHGVLDDGVDFLPKPYGAEDLARRVREVLDRA